MILDSMRSRARILAAGVIASLAPAGCATQTAEMPADLDQRIAQARTRSEHEALAGVYEREASLLQAKSREHEQRALVYGPPAQYGRMQDGLARHCNYLAAKYREAAEANLALAGLHRRLAADSQE